MFVFYAACNENFIFSAYLLFRDFCLGKFSVIYTHRVFYHQISEADGADMVGAKQVFFCYILQGSYAMVVGGCQ